MSLTTNDISLLASAENARAELTPEETVTLQSRLWELLARQTALYAMGDSSVPRETAQELMNSIYFTLGLKQNSSPLDWRELLEDNLPARFAQGRKSLEQKIVLGKQLWQAACLSAPPIENLSLTSTLKSIGTFWKKYDRLYFAHEIPCDIDYQLCYAVPDKLYFGVDYINEYLRRILMESDFLRRLDTALCVRVLKQDSPDYKGLLVNLCMPAAVNAIGLALANRAVQGLDVSEEARRDIRLRTESLSRLEAIRALREAADTACVSLGIQSPASLRYFEKLAAGLLPRIRAAQGLEGIFRSLAPNP